MVHVYVSHQSADDSVSAQLRDALVDAGHTVFLDFHPSDGIKGGERWKERLRDELERSDAVVCLLTRAYSSSPWCSFEINLAEQQGTAIYPLIAEAGVTHPLLDEIQSIDYVSNRAGGTQRLTTALSGLTPRRHYDGRGPVYPGLRPFRSEDRQVFFGRTSEVAEVIERLESRARPGAIDILVGPSGCGKSSLVRAGVAPALGDRAGWSVLDPIEPHGDPTGALVGALTAAAVRVGLGWTTHDVRTRVEAGLLQDVATDLLQHTPTRPRQLLLVVDQLEQLVAPGRSEAERDRFVGALRPALGQSVRVLGTLRPEFLADVLADLALPDPEIVPVRPLRPEQLRTVITEPARIAGREIPDELVERLLADTGSGDALPLLAFTLAQLDARAREAGARRLSIAEYERMGGVPGALATRAGAAMAAALAGTGPRPSEDEVLRALLSLVGLDGEGRRTRRARDRHDLTEREWAILAPFVTDRLLLTRIANPNAPDCPVEVTVAHEKIFYSWPTLADAITDRERALRTRTAIEADAAVWTADLDRARHPRADGGPATAPADRLWEGGRLDAGWHDVGARFEPSLRSAPWTRERSVVSDKVHLSEEVRAFLGASRRRELLRRGRSRAILSMLLVVALVGAVVATVQGVAANRQRDDAVVAKLIVQSEQLRSTDSGLAAQLALVAHRMAPGPDLRGRLLDVGNGPLSRALPGHAGQVVAVAYRGDGRVLASAGTDGTVRLWALDDPAGARPTGAVLPDHGGPVSAVAFSPDRRTLASGGPDGVRLWDTADPARPRALGDPIPAHRDGTGPTATGALALAFGGADGHLLGVGDVDGVQLWDVARPGTPVRRGPVLATVNQRARSAAFSPDGRTIVVPDGTDLRFWDLTAPDRPVPRVPVPTGHTLPVNAVAYSPDGRTVATGSGDRSIALWNVADPAHPAPWTTIPAAHSDFVNAVAFSPDGGTLVSGGGDRLVRLWTVADPAHAVPRGEALAGHGLAVRAVAFAPDGRGVASGGEDGPVRMWTLPTTLSTGHTDEVDRYRNGVAVSPDGRSVVVGNEEGTVRSWDVTDVRHAVPRGDLTRAHAGSVDTLAYRPDGRVLATGGDDRVIRLWDVTDPGRPVPLGPALDGLSGRAFSVRFSPDGRTLVAGDENGNAVRWDVADPSRPVRTAGPVGLHDNAVNDLVFDPTGRLLATASGDYTSRLWDVSDPRRVAPASEPITDHTLYVNAVRITPDGRTLVTASGDHHMRLTDITDPGRPRAVTTLTESTNPLFAADVSPDGRLVAAGGSDRAVRLWDIADPAHPVVVGALTGVTDTINAVAFGPDGRTVVAGSYDQTARLWDVDTDRVAQRICADTGPILDRAAWSRLVSPELAYDPPCGPTPPGPG